MITAVIWLGVMKTHVAILLLVLTGCSRTQINETIELDDSVSTMNNVIKILGERDTGNGVVQKFAFISGRTEDGVDHLIRILDTAEISLMNDEDEGGEGSTTFRKTDNGLESKDGGHGWQSEWKIMTRDQIRDRMLELAPNNLGGHWSTEGSITRRNAR